MKLPLFFQTIFLFIFLTSSISLHSKKPVPPNNQTGLFIYKTPWAFFSPEFVEYILYYKTGWCITGASAFLAYNLYNPEWMQLKNYMYNNRHACFLTILSGMGIAYAMRNNIKNYIYQTENENNEIENDSKKSKDMSTARLSVYMPGEINLTFDDVAGLDAAKTELTDILNFLKYPDSYHAIGAKIPKGVLFSGPPGNGKTLLAKAVAGMANCPCIVVHASSFIEAYVGIGAARIRNLFKIAKSFAPCIVFIDELDSIGAKRNNSCNGASDNESAQALNELLSQMDGFNSNDDPIIIIGATNRINVLDQALLRPGRFDKKIDINMPFFHDRVALIEKILKTICHDDHIDIERIALGTDNFSCADLAHLLNEAALLAVRNGDTAISMKHIDKARDIFLLGLETPGIMHSWELTYKTAVHESGHALVRVLQTNAVPLYKVSIIPRGSSLGVTCHVPIKEVYNHSEAELRAEITVALAGGAAEEIVFGFKNTGIASDLQYARKYAEAIVMIYGMDNEFKDVTFVDSMHNKISLPDKIATKLQNAIAKIIVECKQEAIRLLENNRLLLSNLTDALIEHETLSGDFVYDLCNIEKPALQFNLM